MSEPFALTTGVDILEVERVKRVAERHGERFYQRFFTNAERVYCADNYPSLTARIAAKEAVAKALGTGIGDVQWVEIEVINDDRGKPDIVLHGAAADLAQQLGLTHWSISISHTKTQAVVFVVAMQEPQNI